MISVNGRGVFLQELARIEPVTPAAAGKRWKPIKHIDLVNAIKTEALHRGLAIGDERYTVARDGADMAGALVFNKVPGVAVQKGLYYSIGFVSSNARRKALKMTVGAHISACSNGLCTGEILLSAMHDHNVDLNTMVRDAFTRYVDAVRTIPEMIHDLKSRKLSHGDASDLIMEAGRMRMIGWAAVGRVDAEYRNPTVDHGRGTSWALLNAFTYAARDNIAPMNQMEVFNQFRALLPTGSSL